MQDVNLSANNFWGFYLIWNKVILKSGILTKTSLLARFKGITLGVYKVLRKNLKDNYFPWEYSSNDQFLNESSWNHSRWWNSFEVMCIKVLFFLVRWNETFTIGEKFSKFWLSANTIVKFTHFIANFDT